jgi:hypothetical protein
MIGLWISIGLILAAAIALALLPDYTQGRWSRRRELDALMRRESARKAWEASINRDLRPVDWSAVRRRHGG